MNQERQPTSMSAKLVVAGSLGVGKTTFVNAVSEIPPMRTEETMTSAAVGVDTPASSDTKSSTTVAMDFGRITVSDSLVLFLFGTPGQPRFAFMWDKICTGALGGVLLVDTRQLEASFAAVDYLESRSIPFVVVMNKFPGSPDGTDDELRDALALSAATPVLRADARDRNDVRDALLGLIDHIVQIRFPAAAQQIS